MKNTFNHAEQPAEAKVYINTNLEDEDLYLTSDAALEAPVQYIVVS